MSELPIDTSKAPSFVHQWGLSPAPAWAFATALAASPAFRPVLEAPQTVQSSSGLYKSAPKVVSPYPSTPQVALFTAFSALGGFMIYDNDPTNGSAVVGVWSLLYFMANVKKSMWNLKLYPQALTSLALVNSVFYGGKFLNVI